MFWVPTLSTICSCVTPPMRRGGRSAPFTEKPSLIQIMVTFTADLVWLTGSGVKVRVTGQHDSLVMTCYRQTPHSPGLCSNLIKHQFNDPGISKYKNIPTNRKHVSS